MRKIIVSIHTTLDGFVAGPNGELDWLLPFNEETENDINDLLKTADTIFLGRVSYQGFLTFWPNATAKDSVFAEKMNNYPKIVFSKTLEHVEWGKWNNAMLMNKHVAEEIKKMKCQEGRDMVTFGSPGLVQSLTRLGLVDEYRLVVHPVVLGEGRRLFKDIRDKINLKLIKAKPYSNGAVLLGYQASGKGEKR
jgi:dihydrofolate reductase